MAKTSETYISTIGRRKTSTARVRMTPAEKTSVIINDKPLNEYFATKELKAIVNDALQKVADTKEYLVTVVVKGGGIHSQAEAIRHGMARGLVKADEAFKAEVKKLGFLKRDPRSKERRKFGLKKARKSSQWSKR